jgi:hypothetical protein
MPSAIAARAHPPRDLRDGAIAGAVSCRNRSSAAAIAAACSGPAAGAINSIAGRGGRRLPFVVIQFEYLEGFALT